MKIRECLCIIIWLVFFAGPGWTAEQTVRPSVRYNRGVDFYNRKDYNKAADNFLKALNTENRELEQWTNYNLGNSNFEQAQVQEETDPSAALNLYKNALEFFRRAIDLNPKDKDAKYNFELTAKKIKQTEQQSKQEKQNSQDQKSQGDKQKEREQSQQAGKSEQNKNSSAREQKQQAQEKTAAQSQEQKDKEQEKKSSAAKLQEAREHQEMSQEEALMLLDNFQESEKTPELINKEEQREESPVSKDW